MGPYRPLSGRGSSQGPQVLIPIIPVLAHYGIDIPDGERQVSFCCPVHDEKRPSATVNVEEGVLFCFACNFKGNAIHLVMAMDSIDRPEALERLEVILQAAGHEMKQSVRGRYQRPGEGRSAATGRRYVPPGRRSA